MTIWAAFSLNNRKWGNRDIKVDENNNIVRTEENYNIIETPNNQMNIIEINGSISSESDDSYVL